jgi:hypothetical protein
MSMKSAFRGGESAQSAMVGRPHGGALSRKRQEKDDGKWRRGAREAGELLEALLSIFLQFFRRDAQSQPAVRPFC